MSCYRERLAAGVLAAHQPATCTVCRELCNQGPQDTDSGGPGPHNARRGELLAAPCCQARIDHLDLRRGRGLRAQAGHVGGRRLASGCASDCCRPCMQHAYMPMGAALGRPGASHPSLLSTLLGRHTEQAHTYTEHRLGHLTLSFTPPSVAQGKTRQRLAPDMRWGRSPGQRRMER